MSKNNNSRFPDRAEKRQRKDLCDLRNPGGQVYRGFGLLFKCGPDYIDPMFHSRVLGAKSRISDTFFTR